MNSNATGASAKAAGSFRVCRASSPSQRLGCALQVLGHNKGSVNDVHGPQGVCAPQRGDRLFDWLPNPLILPVGLAVGLLIAVPVGPVNILCIQRAIERGPLGGLPAGVGAVLADGAIALGAALGVGAITAMVTLYRDAIQVIGGLALLVFALLLLRQRPQLNMAPREAFDRESLLSIIWDLPKAFFLTLTNPAAVLGLIAIFGGISSFVEVRGKIDALTLVACVMAGSLMWWTGLSAIVGRLRTRLDTRWLERINQVAGLALIVFAAVLLGEVVLTFATGYRSS